MPTFYVEDYEAGVKPETEDDAPKVQAKVVTPDEKSAPAKSSADVSTKG